MDKKFTPGPWKARIWKDGEAHQGNIIQATDGFEVAHIAYTGAQEDEDAHLIAAAPELFEALLAITYTVEPLGLTDAVNDYKNERHGMGAWEYARQAIDKAEPLKVS